MSFEEKNAPLAGTVHRGPQAEESIAKQHVAGAKTAATATSLPPPTPRKSPQETRRAKQQLQETVEAHEEEKVALVIGGIALGLAALWLWSR